ncbi:50S ribosomal protein L23 [Candidatus Similichlamydia epinepheli]|uniref:50S ribosomal protein L23 n=1 Tax=Candidatus Similichlamydia epinepheli TaxID=1903953 RepID=UPI000D3CDB54|nr:50S ribosomal protein L23 [Candidatus Similichlamydia epinepheli]
MKKDPYLIVLRRYQTEKATVLGGLKDSFCNKTVRRCQQAKYLFVVGLHANKIEIASAVEEIYSERSVRVDNVRTILVKPKPIRFRGRFGKRAKFKKAIVTLEVGCSLD